MNHRKVQHLLQRLEQCSKEELTWMLERLCVARQMWAAQWGSKWLDKQATTWLDDPETQ